MHIIKHLDMTKSRQLQSVRRENVNKNIGKDMAVKEEAVAEMEL